MGQSEGSEKEEMTDIVLAVLVACFVLITNYVAVRLTLHPAQTDSEKGAYKALILIVGLCTVGLMGVQAYRSFLSGENLKHLLSQEGTDIQALREDTKRPIQVNVPAIKFPQTSLSRVPKPDKRAEFKLQALELSTDITAFASSRRNSGLGSMRMDVILPLTKESPDDWQKRWDAEQKRASAFNQETMNLYQTQFERRALALLTEMNSNGINTAQAWYRPGSTENIQQFANDLAIVAKNVH